MVEQSAFGMIPASLINNPKVTAMDIRVYSVMATFLSCDRYCYPSINTIAGRAGVSYRTVTRTLKHLEELGFVKRANQYLDNGGRGSNIYFLDLNPALPPRSSMTYPLGQESPTPSDTDDPLTIQEELDINFKKLKQARKNSQKAKSNGAKVRKDKYSAVDFKADNSSTASGADSSAKSDLLQVSAKDVSIFKAVREKFKDIYNDLELFRVEDRYGLRKKSKFSLIEDTRASEVQEFINKQGVSCTYITTNSHYQNEIIISEELI